MKIGFADHSIFIIQKCRFGDKNVGAAFKSVYVFNEMCSKQTLCPVPVNCISYFFAGDEPYFEIIRSLIEEYEVRGVPGLCGAVIDSVKLFTGLYPSKMFDLSDVIPPVSFCLSLFWQRSLFYRSLSSFLF